MPLIGDISVKENSFTLFVCQNVSDSPSLANTIFRFNTLFFDCFRQKYLYIKPPLFTPLCKVCGELSQSPKEISKQKI